MQDNILDTFLPYQRAFFEAPQKRKLWVSSRQAGKSHTIAGLLVYKALLKGKKGLSLCISVNSRSASEIILKCKMFAEAVKTLSNNTIAYEASADTIRFSNGSRVISLPSTADSLRGFSASTVCIDEAAFVWRLDEVMQAIAPTLTRDPDAELVMTSTPAGQSGFFYEAYLKAKESPSWHVQTTTIHDAIEAGLKVDLDSLHTLCPDPNVFAQEYECEFRGSASQFIDPSFIIQGNPLDTSAAFLGVDFARSGDSTAIVIIDRDTKGNLFVSNLTTLHDVTYAKQLSEIKMLLETHKPMLSMGDATGLGSPLCEQLHSQNSRFKPFVFTTTSKPRAFEYLRSKLLDGKLTFSKDLLLKFKEDFTLVQQTINDAGKTQYTQRRQSNSHADLVSALVIALEAEHSMPLSQALPMPFARQSKFGTLISRL